jgi:predicted nuclease of predicted toxin-antitoxin system
MKILLDECTPHVLKQRLPGFQITTVQELGWTGIKNGELLARAEKQFDVFITTDKNLRYQQNLSGRKLAIIELPTNEVPIVASLAPAIQDALAAINAGDFVEIPLP